MTKNNPQVSKCCRATVSICNCDERCDDERCSKCGKPFSPLPEEGKCSCKLIQGTNGKWRTEYGDCHQVKPNRVCEKCGSEYSIIRSLQYNKLTCPNCDTKKEPQTQVKQEKCESCLAGFSREDVKGNCTCSPRPASGWESRFDKKWSETGLGEIEIGDISIKDFFKSFISQAIEQARKNTDYETYEEGFTFGMKQARQDLLSELRESIDKKSVAELEEKMGSAYKDLSVKVAYKEGYNSALDSILEIISLKMKK